jgi:hypothetical protein
MAVATFSLTLLVSTQGGEAYTFADYERMFDNAGSAAAVCSRSRRPYKA